MTPTESKPPVWPAFVGLAAALGISQAVGAVLLGALFAAHLLSSGALDQEPTVLLRGLGQALGAFLKSPSLIVGASAASSMTFLGTSLVGARLAKTTATARLRLGPSNLPVWKTALAAVGAIAITWLYSTLMSALHLDRYTFLRLFDDAFKKATFGVYIVAFVLVGLAAPAGEELFFRGFMQTRLAQRWSRWAAIAVTAALFGAMHMDPVQSPMALLVGLYFGWLTERTGSIRPALVAHAANNSLSAITARYLRDDAPPFVTIVIVIVAIASLAASVLVLRERKSTPALREMTG